MKRLWTIIGFSFLSLFAALGLSSSNVFASHQPIIKVNEIKETTPLYLTHGSNLIADSIEGMTSWHYSHSSHNSHWSHRSHYSHYSSR